MRLKLDLPKLRLGPSFNQFRRLFVRDRTRETPEYRAGAISCLKEQLEHAKNPRVQAKLGQRLASWGVEA